MITTHLNPLTSLILSHTHSPHVSTLYLALGFRTHAVQRGVRPRPTQSGQVPRLVSAKHGLPVWRRMDTINDTITALSAIEERVSLPLQTLVRDPHSDTPKLVQATISIVLTH